MSTAETATSTHHQPSIIEPLGSAVRFETQCIVIPDPERSRRPRVVTKSYAFPLWKKRTSSTSTSASALPEDAGSEEHQSQLVLRVPLPTFSRKHHLTTRSVDHTPLPPCLVHRAQPSSSSCDSATSESLVRPARPPRKSSLSPTRPDAITVPLRPCCAACQSVTEAAIVNGDAWPERFSRAASKRRSMSVDEGRRTITVAGSAASASYGALGIAISVDEIDKRRRSSDTGLFTPNPEILFDDAKAKRECKGPMIFRRSSADARSPPSPATPRIPEEEDDEDVDESELFPLPSPKRTPSTSPAPSPGGSLSSFATAQTHASPTLSACSGESACSRPSKRQFLAPPASSSSSLSLPKFSDSTVDLTLAEDPPPSPSLLSTLPTLSGRHSSLSPIPRISFVPPTSIPSATSSTLPTTLSSPLSMPASGAIPTSPNSSEPSTSPHHSPTHSRFPWRFKRSVSAEVISSTPSSATLSSSPSSSPRLSTCPKKPSLMSSPRYVMQDVLRGVGSIGSGGITSGMGC